LKNWSTIVADSYTVKSMQKLYICWSYRELARNY